MSQIIWPELWILPVHGGYGVDPLLPSPSLPHYLEQLGRNSLTRVALDQADAWVLPTTHQANSFPNEFQTNVCMSYMKVLIPMLLDQTLMLILKLETSLLIETHP